MKKNSLSGLSPDNHPTMLCECDLCDAKRDFARQVLDDLKTMTKDQLVAFAARYNDEFVVPLSKERRLLLHAIRQAVFVLDERTFTKFRVGISSIGHALQVDTLVDAQKKRSVS